MQTLRKILFTLIGIVLALAVIAFVLGIVFKDQLVAWAKTELDRELAADAVYLDYEIADLKLAGTLRLHLTDITSWKTSARETPDAHLTALDLAIPLWASLRDRSPHIRATTKEAVLTIHGDNDESEDARFTDLALKIDSGPGQLKIPRLSALFQGVRLNATGHSELPSPAPDADRPIVEVVEIPEEPTEPVPSALDLSPALALIPALDYREAGFSPSVDLDFVTNLLEGGGTGIRIEGKTVSFPSRDRDLEILADLQVAPEGEIAVQTLTLHDGDARAEATLSVQGEEKLIRIDSLTSNLDWVAILRDYPGIDPQLDRLTWKTPAELNLSGTWSTGDPNASDLQATLRGLDATWAPEPDGTEPLTLTDVQLDARLQNGDLHLSPCKFSLADGAVELNGRLRPFEKAMPWSGAVQGNGLSLTSLSAYAGDQIYPGRLNLKFEGAGGREVDALNGKGDLQIEESRFVDVPILGSLVDLLASILPPMAEATSDQLAATFRITGGILTTDDLHVGVSAGQVDASGEIDLAARETNFEATANLRGLLGRLTSSVSNVLSIEGGGPIDEVAWKFKNIGRADSIAELLKAATTDAAGAGSNAEALTESIGKDTAGELMEAGEKVADKLSGFLKDLTESTKPGEPAKPSAPPKATPPPTD